MTITVDDAALFAELRALKREWGNPAGLTAAEVARVKAALDPDELFNPGKLVSLAPRKPSA